MSPNKHTATPLPPTATGGGSARVSRGHGPDKRARGNEMIALWNAHNLDGYLKLFWDSDRLLIVQDGASIFGWRKLRERYLQFYPNGSHMGEVTLEGIKIEAFDHDYAQALCWWNYNLGGSKSRVIDIILFRRFNEGWAIVSREIFD